MLQPIQNDLFDIAYRVKEIDSNYYIVFNKIKKRFEVHNSGQKDSYCLTVPYDELDARTLDFVNKTKIENAEKLYREMDLHNEMVKKEECKKIFDKAMYETGL